MRFITFVMASAIRSPDHGRRKYRQILRINPDAKEWEDGNENPFCPPAVLGRCR